jgi:hypothetical protein
MPSGYKAVAKIPFGFGKIFGNYFGKVKKNQAVFVA